MDEARSLLLNGELMLSGPVGPRSWGDFNAVDVRHTLGLMTDSKPVARINSPGGSVFEGLAVYNALIEDGRDFHVIIDSIAASMASFIILAGKTIEITEHASVMIHNPRDVGFGDAEELRTKANQLQITQDKMIALYASKTGRNEEEIMQWMRDETWFHGQEAVDAGFVNSVRSGATATAYAFDYRTFKNAPTALITEATERFARSPVAVVPAEPTKEETMSDTPNNDPAGKSKKTPAKDPVPSATAIVPSDPVATAQDTAAIENAAVERYRQKASGVREAAKAANIDDDEFIDGLINNQNLSLEGAKAQIIDRMAASDITPEPKNHIQIIADGVERFHQGAEQALMIRSNLVDPDGKERENEFMSMRLEGMAQHALQVANISTKGMNRMEMVGMAFNPIAAGYHSTSDFGNLLSNVANKAMLKGYREAPETYHLWTAKGSMSDFKPLQRVDIGLFPSLEKVEEGGEYKYASIGDRSVMTMLATYGRLFSITRQAIINDDLGAFTRIPRKMGDASRRTIGNLVYAILNDNPKFQNKALFHTDRKNIGTPGAPSKDTFSEAKRLMMKQQDKEKIAHALNIAPAFVLNGPDIDMEVAALLNSTADPDAQHTGVKNPVRNMAQQITDARINGNAYTFVADPRQADTIEVTYLDGQERPYLEQRHGWSVDGAQFKVRIDAGVNILDYIGMVQNAGAS